MSESSGDRLIGETIAGRYLVERRIARGGMGVVYVAKHLRLQRPVVFKVLSEHLADDEKASARFEQEALGLSRLNHPNVVTVHDFGVEDGVTYIVMEYVPGLTLSDLLRRDGVMTFERFLPLGTQMIEAIAAAHQKDIVHRDIKPANIMVVSEPDRPDLVKVLDFGLARLTSSSLDITKDNLVGTVSYVAPEVVKGSRAGKAADIYALGVLFYFLLTGRKPFKGEDDLSVLYKHVHDTPVSMDELLPDSTDVPYEFVQLIARCLAKDPKDRPPNGRALLEELAAIVPLPNPPRIGSGEFPPAEASGLAPSDRLESPGTNDRPEAGEVPSRPSFEGSFELSSMALRERPNSRWGIPLIALCVFLAGAAAVLLLGPSGADEVPEDGPTPAGEAAPDEATPSESMAGASETTEVDAREPDDAPVAVDEAPADENTEQRRDEASAANDRSPPTSSKREAGPSKRNESPAAESKAPARGPKGSAKPTTASESGEGSDDVPTFAPDESSPGLLEVDESDDNVLLPVE